MVDFRFLGFSGMPFLLENWEQYLAHLNEIGRKIQKSSQWVSRIIDQIPEREQIDDEINHLDVNGGEVLIRYTPDFFLIAGLEWRNMGLNERSEPRDLSNFNLLAFTRDRTLRTIRDLTGDHIPHLQLMKEETERVIHRMFPEVENSGYRLFFHYTPSTYHLHINVERHDSRQQLHEFSFDHVIENLRNDPMYYRGEIEIFKF
jgi:hypothetical protein